MKAELLPRFVPVPVLVAALAFASQAHAQRHSDITAQKLVQICTADPNLTERCDAYIDGVADAVYTYQMSRPPNGSKGAALPGYICIPSQVTGTQLRETFVQFIQAHPNEAGREAGGAVLRALDARFRCPGPNR